MLSYSSLTNSGKVTLPSIESWGTNMNIIRDPPKSIMTKRRDKVGENSDILQMIDNSDRSSEAILRFSRGVNPFVSVSYTNNGGSLQNYGNQQARLPYSINKDGDFRPPVQAPQDLLPLSRLPRNITSAITQPSMPHFGKELQNSRNIKTTNSVKEQIISSQVRPTKRYYIQKPFQEAFETNYNIQDILKKSAGSNVSTTNRTRTNVLEPTKEIINNNINAFANSNVSTTNRTSTNVLQPTKEINNNNINAFANSNVSNPKYVNKNKFDSTKFIQDTNTHSVYTNLHDAKNIHMEPESLSMKQKDFLLVEYSAPKNVNKQPNNNLIQENYVELERTLPVYMSQTNNMGLNNSVSYIHDDIELDRNLPEYQSRTNFNSNMKHTPLFHDELELERVLPVYHTSSNIKGTGEHINYIHKDVELERTLPEYQTSTNIKQNTQKILKHDYMKELDRKTYLSNMSTNNNKKGENNVSSRAYNLEDKLQYGEYNIPANIPTFERTQPMVEKKYESEKSKMGKRVSEQFHGKYK